MGDLDSTAPLEGTSEPTLGPGARLGVYELVRELGRGSHGAVYEALKQPLGKRVALKVLHRELAGRREVVERFAREAEVVAALEHPHIVQVFDVGSHQGVDFLVMEYLDGETLGARLAREGSLPSDVAVDLLLGAVSAVAAAHARGVIHRDLKPENVFLARMPVGPPVARLLDFGVAKVLTTDVALTGSRAFIGTPRYMSPEQAAESRELTGASDQWSLAVILYECVTGAVPFQATTLLTLLTAIADEPHEPACALAPSVPEGLSAVLDRALAKRPEARFPSVRAFGAALLPYASAMARAHATASLADTSDPPPDVTPAPPPQVTPPTPAPDARRALRRRLAALAALATLGLLAAVALAPRPPERPPVTTIAGPVALTSPLPPPPPPDVPAAAPAPPPVADDVPLAPEDAPRVGPRHVYARPSRHRDAATAPPPPNAPRHVRCPNGICPVD